jgi:hypothetical protein
MMEDVCILICIPQASASRKLSWRRGGRLMPTMMGARESPSPFLFHISCFIPLQMGFFARKFINWDPPKKGAGVASWRKILP